MTITSPHIVILGSNGMLGSMFHSLAIKRYSKVTGLTEKEIDITKDDCIPILLDSGGDIFVNCTAYTAVDQAESDRERAQAVNADGVRRIVQIVKSSGKRLVHVSTDYVFSGDKSGGYTEDDMPHPLSAYGYSKWMGEQEVIHGLDQRQYLLVRTAWLYGPNGKNFVSTMLNLAQKGQPVRVVNDQFGCPTYTNDLSLWIMEMLDMQSFGIFHAVNSGTCSWFHFAEMIFKESGFPSELVIPIPTKDYPTPAKRPQYSILKNDKLSQRLGNPPRHYKDALLDYINHL